MKLKYPFTRVVDPANNQPLAGLWHRGNRFYVAVTVSGRGTRRLPLQTPAGTPAATLEEALAAAALVRADAATNQLQTRQTPAFSVYVKDYLQWLETTKAKSPLTIERERSVLKDWVLFLGSVRLCNIFPKDLRDYANKRSKILGTGSINLAVMVLHNLLKAARNEGLLKPGVTLVTESWTPLKYNAPHRSLITSDQLQALVTEARSLVPAREFPVTRDERWIPKYPNGNQFANLVLFMAYSGARREAALTAKWENVDWKNRQLTLFTKFDKKVVVDFNDKLQHQLEDHYNAQIPMSPWLFPSPTDALKHWKNPGPLKDLIAKAAGLPGFHFHDLRHYFISHCIMAGVDTLTVASWVGHSDGGVLIGSIYGHLNPQHKRESAAKVNF